MATTSRNIVNSGIKAAFANNGVWTAAGGALENDQVIAAILGDSLTNSNTFGTGETVQDSWSWGMLRNWQCPLSGFFSPTNNNVWSNWTATSAEVTAASTTARGYTSGTPVIDNDPMGTHLQDNYGSRPIQEYEFTGNVAASKLINQCKLNNGTGDWHDADWWIGETVSGGFLMYGYADMLATLQIGRQGDNLVDGDVASLDSNTGWFMLNATDAAVGAATDYRVRIRTPAAAVDETGNGYINAGAYIRVATKNGWQLGAFGIGGAKFTDWNDPARNIDDTDFALKFGPNGYPANLFIIALGANGSTEVTQAQIELLIERCHAANNDCKVLLVGQYGTPASISQATALAQGVFMDNIARAGTANVAGTRIAHLNTPVILGAAAEAGDLVDVIHPKKSWVDEVAAAWWTEITTATEPPAATAGTRTNLRIGIGL